MQKLKAYIHCPKRCKFVPIRFCKKCDKKHSYILEKNGNKITDVKIKCKHNNDCFSEGDN